MKTQALARLVAALSAVAILGGLSPAGAAGPEAPMLLAQDPAPGAKLAKAPARVSFTFNQPIDASHSRIEINDACGNIISSGVLEVNVTEMATTLTRKPRGTYTIFYAAQSIPKGATGETTSTFEITVKKGKPCK